MAILPKIFFAQGKLISPSSCNSDFRDHRLSELRQTQFIGESSPKGAPVRLDWAVLPAFAEGMPARPLADTRNCRQIGACVTLWQQCDENPSLAARSAAECRNFRATSP
jgi:hypothetical protein